MISLEQAISDLKKMELVELDNNKNPVQEGQDETCLTKSELIIFLEKLGHLEESLSPQKPILPFQTYYGCPACHGKLYGFQKHCDRCGQLIDWT